MTLTKRDYDYYINLRKIKPEAAIEYRDSFRPKTEKTEETPVMTEAEIEQKNIDTMEQALAQKEVEKVVELDWYEAKKGWPNWANSSAEQEKRPEISYSAKEVKKMLFEKWVKNAKFLTDEKAMAKAKEIWL